MEPVQSMGVESSPWKFYVDPAQVGDGVVSFNLLVTISITIIQDVICYHNFETGTKVLEHKMTKKIMMDIVKENLKAEYANASREYAKGEEMNLMVHCAFTCVRSCKGCPVCTLHPITFSPTLMTLCIPVCSNVQRSGRMTGITASRRSWPSVSRTWLICGLAAECVRSLPGRGNGARRRSAGWCLMLAVWTSCVLTKTPVAVAVSILLLLEYFDELLILLMSSV